MLRAEILMTIKLNTERDLFKTHPECRPTAR